MNKTSVRGTKTDLGSNLDLAVVLKDLISDGLIAQQDAAEIASARRSRKESLQHPLRNCRGQTAGSGTESKPLTLELLSEWLAKKACLQLAHIDPLKINVPAVTGIMSLPMPALRHSLS